MAVGLLVDQDHPAAQLLAVLRLEGFLHVLGSDLDPAGAQLPQREGRVDDVPGVLDRADAALLVEGPQPALAADSEPLGDRLDLLIDLGRRDLQLPAAESLLDQRAVDQQLEDLLALAGHALVGELLAGDDLAVDDRDRVGGIDRDHRLRESPGTSISLRFFGLASAWRRARRLRGAGGGHLVSLLVSSCWARAGAGRHHQDDQDEPEQPHSATAILCDHHVASPQFLW